VCLQTPPPRPEGLVLTHARVNASREPNTGPPAFAPPPLPAPSCPFLLLSGYPPPPPLRKGSAIDGARIESANRTKNKQKARGRPVVSRAHPPFQQQNSSFVGSGIDPKWQFRVSCEDEPEGQPCQPASRPHPSQKHEVDMGRRGRVCWGPSRAGGLYAALPPPFRRLSTHCVKRLWSMGLGLGFRV
jgi:hypothetical protein